MSAKQSMQEQSLNQLRNAHYQNQKLHAVMNIPQGDAYSEISDGIMTQMSSNKKELIELNEELYNHRESTKKQDLNKSSSSSNSSKNDENNKNQNQNIKTEFCPSFEIKVEVHNKYVDEISALRPQFQNQISLENNSQFKWICKEDKKDVKFHINFNDKTEEICTRVQMKMNLPKGPQQLIELIKSLDKKLKYDPMFEAGCELGQYEDGVIIQNWLLKGQAVVAQRHFTLLTQQHYEQNGDFVEIVAKGLDEFEGEKDIPYNIKNAVRVKLSVAGWQMKRIGKSDEYDVIYMQCSNPNGKLPFFIKKQTPKFALDMVKNIKKIIDKENKQKN